MDQRELINYVVDALDRHGIPSAVTGSHASSVFGEVRFTNDIDVVIQLSSQERLKQFLTEFPEGTFYVSAIVRDMQCRTGDNSTSFTKIPPRKWI